MHESMDMTDAIFNTNRISSRVAPARSAERMWRRMPSGSRRQPRDHLRAQSSPGDAVNENGAIDDMRPDRAAESARELKKSIPQTGIIDISECCTNCCTKPPPERPKTPWNAPEPPIFHNNIHKAESFRNRQVIGSSPIVGSTKFPRIVDLAAAMAALVFVCF